MVIWFDSDPKQSNYSTSCRLLDGLCYTWRRGRSGVCLRLEQFTNSSASVLQQDFSSVKMTLSYFSGPMAHLFYGVHEQTHIPFTIAYSACIGPYARTCRQGQSRSPHLDPHISSAPFSSSSLLLPLTLTLFAQILKY